jgi:hypothetical protein
MKRLSVLLLLVAILITSTGCALTKWECRGYCLDYERAVNKCLAQANSAFGKSSVKSGIWGQCMRGEGYVEVPCSKEERNNPRCSIMHVW